MFLSAEHVMMSFESNEMSSESTGSYWSQTSPASATGEQKNESAKTDAHFVTVERQEELEGVGEENFDSRVQQADREQLAIWTVLDGQDVVRHLEGLRVCESEDSRGRTTLDFRGNLSNFEIPELDVLVGRARDESSAIRTDVEGPQRPGVRGNGLEKR